MRKILSRSLLGLLLIVIGVGYMGNHLGLWEGFDIFFDGWWAILFILIPSVLSMISDGIHQGNTITALIGLILFLSQIEVLEGVSIWKIILCAIVIVIGLGIIFKPAVRPRKKIELHYTNGSATTEKQHVSFGSSTFGFDGQKFEGGRYSVSFGELILDLRGATIEHDCELDINVAFGSLELKLPENVVLINNTGSFFGGVDINRNSVSDPNFPKIILSGTCAFGGVEVE